MADDDAIQISETIAELSRLAAKLPASKDDDEREKVREAGIALGLARGLQKLKDKQ